jgi:copper(I)-binding protein
MTSRPSRHSFIASLGAGLSLLNTAALAEVKVTDPWIAEAPPTAMALAAFMVLENDGDAPRSLVAAEARGFDRIELHQSIEENGVHRMIRQEEIRIPANGRTPLEPGGYHVMLIGIQEPLKAGDEVPMRLIFADGENRQVEVPVRRRHFMK